VRTASTIGAGGLNFRVRDGTGCFPAAQITRGICFFKQPKLRRCSRTLKTEQKVERELHTRRFQSMNILRASPRALVVVRSGLTSFTRLPYQGRSLRPRLLCRADGGSNLGAGFPLRCFQRLSLPNLATQRCRWHDNWHTSGPSTLVLSY
jgi:hypothetical protein